MSAKWHSMVYWTQVWRRLHCLGDLRRDCGEGTGGWHSDAQFIDTGYCLDRYSLRDAE